MVKGAQGNLGLISRVFSKFYKIAQVAKRREQFVKLWKHKWN
jgi:hypothetical protein